MKEANPLKNLTDPNREIITLSLVVSAADVLGINAARDLLNRELRQAPNEIMSDAANQAIWLSAKAMLAAGRIPTLTDLRLRPELQFVPADRWQAIEASTDGVNLGEHISQLAEVARRRAAFQTAQRLAQAAAGGEDVSSAVNSAKNALTQALTLGGAPRIRRASEFRGSEHAAVAQSLGLQRDFTTGIKVLDAQLGGGILPGKMMILAAPSGKGKTRFALRMALANAVKGERSLYVSGEMKALDVPDFDSNWQQQHDENGELLQAETHDIYNALEDMAAGVTRSGKGKALSRENRMARRAAHQWMLDTDMITLFDDEFSLDTIASLAYQCKSDGAGLMFIDNLTHVMRTGTGSRGEENEAIWYKNAAERIAAIARDTGVSIVVLLQPSANEKISAGDAPREHEMGASRAVVHGASYVVTAGRSVDAVTEAWAAGKEGLTDAQLRVIKCRYRGGQGLLNIKYSDKFGLWYGYGDGEPGPVVDLSAYLNPQLEVSA